MISPTISSLGRCWQFPFVRLRDCTGTRQGLRTLPNPALIELRLAGLRLENPGSAKFAVGVHASDTISGNAGLRHGLNVGPRPTIERG